MATNTTKKKFSFWKGLLWIIAILAVLNMITEGKSTDFITGIFNPSDSSSNTVQTDAPTQPTINRLPSVPDTMREHVYLTSRGYGACTGFTGNVKFYVVFVSDPEAAWTEDRITQTKQEIEATMARIRQDAAAYGAVLNLTAEDVTARAEAPLVRKEWTDWANSALTSISLPGMKNGTAAVLEERYGVDAVPIIFCTNQNGRSFAQSYSGSTSATEGVLIYGDTKELYHEVCHVFGAEDFYYPTEVAELAKTYLPDSIMANSAEGMMEDLTAYCIGWTDTLSDNAMQFLQKTSHLTQAYLAAQKLLESQTGYVENFATSSGIYTGYLVDGVRHGQGTLVWSSGSVYTGTWEHGVRHGQGRMTFDNGDVYDGQWQDGIRQGMGTYIWANGNRYVGEFVENSRQGQGTMYYTDGSQYTGQWWGNERNGQGKHTFPEGHTYEGSWKDGTFHGQGVFIWTMGDKYVGEYVDGNRQGYGVYYYPNGSRYEGQWYAGEQHGQGTMYYSDGSKRSGKWDNGNFIG